MRLIPGESDELIEEQQKFAIVGRPDLMSMTRCQRHVAGWRSAPEKSRRAAWGGGEADVAISFLETAMPASAAVSTLAPLSNQ
jgi:hypothetical protein